MNTNLTLPGNIPDILRPGLPVTVHLDQFDPDSWVRGVVLHPDVVAVGGAPPRLYEVGPGPECDLTRHQVRVDLTDRLARVAVTWWFDEHVDLDRWPGGLHHLDDLLGPGHYDAFVCAGQGDEMDDEEVTRLRTVVLHLVVNLGFNPRYGPADAECPNPSTTAPPREPLLGRTEHPLRARVRLAQERYSRFGGVARATELDEAFAEWMAGGSPEVVDPADDDPLAGLVPPPGWTAVRDRMPQDGQFVLLLGPSGYNTTPHFVTLGRTLNEFRPPDERGPRWLDPTNTDLWDNGWRPTHWTPWPLPGLGDGGTP